MAQKIKINNTHVEQRPIGERNNMLDPHLKQKPYYNKMLSIFFFSFRAALKHT